MKWEPLPQEFLLRALTPPKGHVRMVLDTDTYNEVDDQFALSYALLSKEKLTVEAVYAAPFHNARSEGPCDGMEKSYGEIRRLLALMDRESADFAYRGSTSYLKDENTPIDSEAARDLVRRAMLSTPEDPLYVAAIGAITNVASALLMEPNIRERVRIVWLGGHPLSYPDTAEFNLMQDVRAARVIFDCGAPVTLIPCIGVASHLLATIPDIRESIGGKNKLCDALIELFCAYADQPFGWAKEIWDVSTIAYLNNPDWVPSVLKRSPLLTDDCHWASDPRRHFIREAYFTCRTPIFRDLYNKLGGAK